MYIERNAKYPSIVADDGRILVKNLCNGTIEVELWNKNDYRGSRNFFMKTMKKEEWQAIDEYIFEEGGWSTCNELEDLTGIEWRELNE